MTELDALSRALLSAVAGCHEPSQADRARVRRHLIARLGVAAGLGAVGTAATQTSPAMAATAGGAVAKSSLAGTLFGSAKVFAVGKLVGVTIALGAAGLGSYQWVKTKTGPGTHAAVVATAARAVPHKAKAPLVTSIVPALPAGATTSESERVGALDRAETLPVRAAERVAIVPSVQQSLGETPQNVTDAPALPPVASFPSETPNLAAEARGLARAQAALREGDPEQALSLLDQQKVQFVDGSLEEERSAARVLALCRAGNVQAANIAAADFLRRSPHSVLAERVANACPNRR